MRQSTVVGLAPCYIENLFVISTFRSRLYGASTEENESQRGNHDNSIYCMIKNMNFNTLKTKCTSGKKQQESKK